MVIDIRKIGRYGVIGTIILASHGNTLMQKTATLVDYGYTAPESTEFPVFPDHGTVREGTFNINKRYMDLVCTGEAGVQAYPLNAIIKGVSSIPNLIEIDDSKTIVFRTPSPMGTLTLPRGYTAYVTIKLRNIVGKFTNNMKHLALGIREENSPTYLSKLCIPVDGESKRNTPSIRLHMSWKNVIEFVPLFSVTDMSQGEYTAPTPGKSIDSYEALAGQTTETTFDFGSVYRVSIQCLKTYEGNDYINIIKD